MGARGAGRLRLRRQGIAFRHQPAGAGAKPAIRSSASSVPACSSWATGWVRWSGSSRPTKKFDEADFGGFLELLPPTLDGRHLRHVVEVRHDSFRTPAFVALLRRFKIAVVYAEHATFPAIADVTGDFVYARLQKAKDSLAAGYPPKALDQWAERLRVWAGGGTPDDLAPIDPDHRPEEKPRDVFAYVIHEGKVRAPAAAMALIGRLGA